MVSRSRNVKRRSLKKRTNHRKRCFIRKKNNHNQIISRRKNTRGKRSSRRIKRSSRRRSSVIRRSIKTPMAPRKGKKMIGGDWEEAYNSYGIYPQPLGKGMYGEVYEVTKPANLEVGLQIEGVEVPSTYALKVLKVGGVATGYQRGYRRKKVTVDDIWHTLREAAILKGLSNHPNLPTLLLKPILANDETMILAMEKCDMNLFKFKLEYSIPPIYVKHIAKEILKGLEFIHSKCIIHRDIKPENIGINLGKTVTDIQVKLLDFGSATILTNTTMLDSDGLILELSEGTQRVDMGEPSNKQMSCNAYTTWYRPPEVCMIFKNLGEPDINIWAGNAGIQLKMYDYKADMWAAGCCIAELLMGGNTLFKTTPVSENPTDTQFDKCIRLSLFLEGEAGLNYLLSKGNVVFKEFVDETLEELVDDEEIASEDVLINGIFNTEMDEQLKNDILIKIFKIHKRFSLKKEPAPTTTEEEPAGQAAEEEQAAPEPAAEEAAGEAEALQEPAPWCITFLKDYVIPLLKFNPDNRLSAAQLLDTNGVEDRDTSLLTPPSEEFKTTMLQMCKPYNLEVPRSHARIPHPTYESIKPWFNTNIVGLIQT